MTFVLLLLLAGCPAPEDDDDEGLVDVPELDAFIEARLDTAEVPGLAAAIVVDGALRWVGAYGWANLDEERPITPDTTFMLASVSKTITATAVMQVVEDGGLALSDDVEDALSFSVTNPGHPSDPITTRQLLLHTSSIVDNWDILAAYYVQGDSPVALGAYLEDYLDPAGALYDGSDNDGSDNYAGWAPGGRYDYSNMGATLAGFLVEATTGVPFDTHCETHIFEPLGMTDTGWHLADVDASVLAMPYGGSPGNYRPYGHYGYPDYPDGALRTSVVQLASFLGANMGDGSLGPARILESGTLEQMRTVSSPTVAAGQGLIWYYEPDLGEDVIGHNGGDDGVSTDMYYRLSDGVGIIVLTNGEARYGPMLAIEEEMFSVGETL
ncbi:MAG: beta-lactamase family protein [Deltaproteobacteria bacterium]|nr:beta-lactamase family protein [Deltaproteobacteria bacterium]